MDKNINDKQGKLNSIIRELSDQTLEGENIKKYVDSFGKIYDGSFRHSYSSVTGLMLQLHNEEKSLQLILQNLDVIKESVDDNQTEQGLYKLYDHISLESIRIDELYNSYRNSINEANETINKANETIDKLENEATRLKTDVITILSIFAAIVLTFMGGMSFTASTFNGIASVSVFRLVFIMAIVGIIIFDTVAMLLYLIARIINRSIAVNCKTEDCSCEKRCSNINILRLRYPLVFWFNILLLIFIIGSVIVYCVTKCSV